MSETKTFSEQAAQTKPPGKLKIGNIFRFGRLVEISAFLYFLVASYILLWPLSNHLGSSTTNEGDALQQLWVMGWGMHALTHDPANLFNGNVLYPYLNTIAYTDHMLAQDLQGLPIYLLSGNLVLTYGILTLFSFVLSGWATYLLVKDMTGNRVAGLFAGTVFAFAHYKIGHLSQLNLLSTQWIPFCFLFLRRLLLADLAGESFKAGLKKGWGLALLLALVFSLNALSTFYYLFYILPLLAIYFVGFYIAQKRRPGGALLVKLGVAGAVAAVAVLPTFLPYVSVVAEQAAERTPREVEQFSANYRFYIGAHWDSILWGTSLSRFAGTGGERTLFPGALAYLLALGGLGAALASWLWAKLRRKQNAAASTNVAQIRSENRERWLFLIIGLFALFMSFGWTLRVWGLEIPGIYRLFYTYFPGYVAMRAVVRYAVFVLFAVALLGGLAVAWFARSNIWQKVGNPRNRKFIAAGVSLVLLGATLFEYRYEIPYINPNILPNPPEVYKWLGQPGREGVVLELPAPPDPANPPSIRDYYATFHKQPQVNGVVGYMPPVEQDIAGLVSQFPSKESLAAFQGIGVRWLVYHLEDENTPLAPAEWSKIEARLAKTPEVKLVQDFPKDKIKLYELTPNPWMRQAYQDLAAGAEVLVSDYRRTQPTLIELFQTMLRRDGHPIYGTERTGYRFLTPPPAGKPVAAGLFAADENPALYGFSPDEATWSGYGLKFYRRKEKLAAVYAISQDPKLEEFYRIAQPLEISLEKDGLKFNSKKPGSGLAVEGDLRVTLQLVSFEAQTIRINGEPLDLAGGLTIWRSKALKPGELVKIEPAAGKAFFLNRAELIGYNSALAAGPVVLSGATILQTETKKDGGRFISALNIWTPQFGAAPANEYILTLDIYRRPWGGHPNGHFGTFSISLQGENRARRVEFNFDPASRDTLATVDGAGAGIGKELFKPGDDTWAAFLAVRRSNPANPQDYPLVGVTRLYEFNLENNLAELVRLLPGKPLVLLPPL